MTLDHRKIEIIQEIAASTHEEFINAVDEVIQRFHKAKFKLDFSRHSSIERAVDIKRITSERPLTNFDMDEFIEEADSLEWSQSVKELLADLD